MAIPIRRKSEPPAPTLVVNPGTVGGLFAPATFVVYNTETGAPEIKKID